MKVDSIKIGVLGAGAWGTALAQQLSFSHEVMLWGRDPNLVQQIDFYKENKKYLAGYPLNASLKYTAHLHEVVNFSNFLLIVTPINSLREILYFLKKSVINLPFIWACKGLEEKTSLFAHQVVQQVWGENAPACGVLSGPSFAKEVVQGLPTATVLASVYPDFLQQSASWLHSERFRVYTSQDVVGVELGGAVKNILAIATGMSDAMGFGLNARAALMTRGLSEIARLGATLGAKLETLMGLSGMGDLILTCTGDLSRNRQVGQQLAKGYSLDTILKNLGHTAEGVLTTKAIWKLAQKLKIDMPITEVVYQVLYEQAQPLEQVNALLKREARQENTFG